MDKMFISLCQYVTLTIEHASIYHSIFIFNIAYDSNRENEKNTHTYNKNGKKIARLAFEEKSLLIARER